MTILKWRYNAGIKKRKNRKKRNKRRRVCIIDGLVYNSKKQNDKMIK